ncbi:hypothetical protein OHB41_34155 [Streptomyces sp. NBC_01571]|uniref:hypothetical protein n=1 Tax=Streptomyces sp. NBC_01571 TaxID=2975883 RepID=UPI0022585B11|nr:hypothetical protein [Streptomyces sp. NBC_01571]MCX4578147.1 hypothetical protein [Streptomyces sp. NBC_01571]
MNDFNQIVSGMAGNTDLYAAVQEARAKLHREHPHGVDVAKIGYEAWRQLTPVQQAQSLDGLFVAYIVRLHDEERAARLDAAAAEVKTYLEGDDEHLLHDALSGIRRPIDEEAEINVYASALSNVLDELDLLRHRLAMRNTTEDGK